MVEKSEKVEKKVNWEIVKSIGSINDKVEVNLVCWDGRYGKNLKCDLRNWYEDKDGNKAPGKGVAIDLDWVETLITLLQKVRDLIEHGKIYD